MSTRTSTRPRAGRASATAADTITTPATGIPHELTSEELELLASGTGSTGSVTAAGAAPAPVMAPPGTTAGAAAVTAGLSISGQRVNVLWSDEGNRNAWAHLETAGWKLLSPLTDSGSTVMTLLAAHARATGHPPYATEDPAGTLASMYVW
ncbi:MAG: hypothetical protein JWN22_2888 [Nocardioides sp.]|jgi:hypothetical protein|nr:hypothetical protein [Nocardioides sp.]